MPDLIPVDHDPFFDPPTNLIPVSHDPFADGPTAKAGQTIQPQNIRSDLAAARQRLPGIAASVAGDVTGVSDAMRAWRGEMTEDEARDFALMAAAGAVVPELKGARAALGAAEEAVPAIARGIRAYHGSPHDFERFDISKIGTGEGAQAYGHGLYFAENPKVAETYDPRPESGSAAAGIGLRETTPGHMYEVNIAADPEHFLDWDKPLSEQPEHIREKFSKAVVPGNAEDDQLLRDLHGADAGHAVLGLFPRSSGAQAYNTFAHHVGDPVETINKLREAGIPGIKYLDQGSRILKPREEIAKDVAQYKQAIEDLKQQPDTKDTREKMHVYKQRLAQHEDDLANYKPPTSNYVVFDDKLIDIIKKYGLAGLVAGGAAHFSTQQVDHDPFATQ
jgi:hypothetical protein